MQGNYTTLPLQPKLNQQARNQALLAIGQTGRALPCTVTAVDGSLVTVKFEVQSGNPWTLQPLTLPKAESAYFRSPTQIGDVGLTIPADTFLGGISGQGSGIANLNTNYGNLGTLIWVPIAATSFAAAPTGKAWANGPEGARLGDSASGVYVDCDVESGTVTISASGKTWTFGPAGLTMASGIVAETHLHGGVTTGGGVTGEPVA